MSCVQPIHCIIWLDSKLPFRSHAEKWTTKTQAVAYHLKGLTNMKHGSLPKAVQRAVRACVEPILLSRTEACNPGGTRPVWNHPSKEVPTRTSHLVQRMNKALNAIYAASCPYGERLEARRIRFAARLKFLDKAHSLAKRTAPPTPSIMKTIKH